ncbi:SDR family NAD(P)-dependent oxidoreductase [Sphingomonas abaci]|uniref:NAD(P)-dependent dehydrogenase (Short-subunit alcohol dehydrogenase family) n=1 Tax=Sphingomonas abaci TaxID=237611 RepID=A0A7W7AHD4_9SPHN|nr:SDR family NAD(P)-dependent oxidoreductase [Sphingomonas abaci]MBB4616304.1 NAD(P)-dependent dehydrogenase (short-subunit alcohol dehydrogenase family) [Sphingomonas abaci]
MDNHHLNGRRALITGGASGIGAATAEALARAGADVAIADIDAIAGQATAAALRAHGVATTFVPLDVADEADWERAVATVIETLGGLDVLVNNAGIERSSLLIDQPIEDLRRMFDVNVIGTTLGIKHAFRVMKPGGPAGQGGAIVNIASVAATIVFPGIAGYSATKSAVDRITRIAAAEAGKLGYGVRVNCVCPGLVPTAMGMKLAVDCAAMGLFPSPEEAVAGVVQLTPSGRLGAVADIAEAILFLCGDGARFVNGTSLSVDGGMGS